jgi:hypothetical protein
MKSQIQHKIGIYTEFEWCHGNYKDWFLEKREKLDESKLTVMFPVNCYITYETELSIKSNRSKPIMKIHTGPSYEEMMGARIKVVSPITFSLIDIEIMRSDNNDPFENSFNTGHVNSPFYYEIELFIRFKKHWYNYGGGEDNFYLFHDRIEIIKDGTSQRV